MTVTDRADEPTQATGRGRWRRGLTERLGIGDLGATGGRLYPLAVLLGFNAVDELDITAFALLTPEIQDTFGISDAALGLIVLFIVVVNLTLGIGVGYIADRANRVRMTQFGAVIWGSFAVVTGLAPGIAVLVVARIGAGLGKAVNAPTHRSLLADYYHPRDRAAIYSLYELANPLGKLLAPLVVGIVGLIGFGWRPPFLLLAIPTAIVLLASVRLVNPVRGSQEREEAGASKELAAVEEAPPSFTEAIRMFRDIPTIRRTWFAIPFLVGGVASIVFLGPQFYDDVFGVTISGRAGISFGGELLALAGLLVGVPIATRGLRKSPRNLLRLVFVVGLVASAGLVLVATGPTLGASILGSMVVSFSTAIVLPALSTLQSLILPPRARSMGFSIGGLFALPGLFFIPISLGVGGAYGLRWAIGVMIPVFLLGAMILASAARTIESDISAVKAQALAGNPSVACD